MVQVLELMKALAGATYRDAAKRPDSDFDFRDGIETGVEEYGATTQSYIEKGYEPQVAERSASIEMGDFALSGMSIIPPQPMPRRDG